MFIKAALLVYAVSLASIALFILGAWARAAWVRRTATVVEGAGSPLRGGESAHGGESVARQIGGRGAEVAATSAEVSRRPAA